MNHIYTVLWNAVLGRFSVASELGRKRSTTQRAARCGVQPRRPTALAALLAMAWAGPGWATLPQDHTLVHGQATVQTANGRMTITQTTPKAILDWQSFNVGMTNRVKFQQPSPSSTVLNRVVGPDSSAIYGRIRSNGRVLLVNPNGVFFAKGASVDVGGLVASTLSVANEDFLAGRCHFSALPNQQKIASVINQGQITVAEGGAVVLLGGYVANGGQIRAQRGLVALASDGRVTLDFGDDGSLQMAVDGAALKAVIHNSGHIEADGGTVWLSATSADKLVQSVIGNTGVIQARTVGEHDGKIYLYADGPGAVVRNWGTLDVSAPQGNGGVISLGGEQVVLFSTTQITAQADAGEHGHLHVTAPHLQVSKEGGIDADVLSATLGRNHVYLNANEGDIQVDAPVAWGQNQLTLDAAQSVHINSTMTASGTSMLNIVHGEAAAGDEQRPSDSGLNMGLSESGFTGRVDFLDVLDQSDPQNRRLHINGESYALLTQTGANGSRTGVDLQGIDGKLDGHYALAADIDAGAAENFKPIGNELEPFSGKFEGLGHQISDLSIDRSSETHAGLFERSAGSTRNLALNKGSVTGRDSSIVVAGSIVGTLLAQGSVANVHTSASVQAHSDQSHTAIAMAGNVIGQITGGNLSNAHALGATSATAFSQGNLAHTTAGGAVGHLHSGSVTNTHAAGPVTASAISRSIQYSRDARSAPIFDSSVPPTYAEGTALSYAGGAIGLKGAGKIDNITAAGPVSDMSTGSTAVSLHALVGNDPGATSGRADKLHAMPVASVQTLAPAMPATPASSPQTSPVMVAVNAAVQAHAASAVPVQPLAPARPATPAPSPQASPVMVAVNKALQDHAASAVPVQALAPAMPATPASSPQASPVMVAVNTAVQDHAASAVPLHTLAPAMPATPASSPQASPVMVAVNAAVHSRASSAPLAQTLASQSAAIHRIAPAAPAVDRPQALVASVSQPSDSVTGADVAVSQTVAVPTQPGVDAGPMALPVDMFAQAVDIRAASDTCAAVDVAATGVARGMPVVPPGVVGVGIAAANAQPSSAAQEVAAATQPDETRPGMRIQIRPAYAAVMATVGSMARTDSAPEQPAAGEDPLYTVIGDGIHRPAR